MSIDRVRLDPYPLIQFTFRATLPKIWVMGVPVATSPSARIDTTGAESYDSSIRVLIVDDDPDDLLITRALLEATAMHVTCDTANTFDDAIAIIAKEVYDAYLVDYRLGPRSGLDLIRETANTASGPMVLLTGISGETVDDQALAVGAADYLSKGELTPHALQRSLRYSIEMWKARRIAEEGFRRYRSLYDGVPAGLFRALPDGTIDEINATAAEMLGYANPVELISLHMKEVLAHPNGPTSVDEALHGEVEVELRKRDGGTCWVSLSMQERRDESGALLHYEGAAVEITRRRQAESAVSFRGELLDQVPSAVIVTDMEGICTFWNKYAETMYGWSTSEAIGKPIYELTVMEEDDTVAKQIMEAIAEEGRWEGEFKVRRRDDTVFPALVSNSLLHGPDGEPIGVVGVSLDLTQTREAEAELRHYQELVTAAYDASPVGKVIVSVPDAIIVSANTAMSEFLGYEPGELQGMPSSELTHPGDLEVSKEEFERLTAGEIDSYTIDKRYLRSDGEVVWGRLQGRLMPRETGTPVHALGQVIDISEAKRAEDQLVFQASLLDQVRTPVVVMDRRGAITYLNPQAEAAYGYTADEVIGQQLLNLVAPDIDRSLKRQILSALSDSGLWEGEVTITRKDGVTFPVWASGATVADTEGHPAGVVGVVLDLSEVKRAEAQTRTQEALNKSLLDSVGVPIAVLMPNGNLLACNPSWNDHVSPPDRPPDTGHLASCVPHDLPSDVIDAVIEGVDSVLQRRRERFTLEYSHERDGDQRWWQVVAMPSGTEGVIVSHWDVTDERFAKFALEENIRAKDDFIASISHELRTPLSVVVGLAEMLRSESLPDVEISEFHDLIADQAQEMALIVEDLLVAGRLETETLTIRPSVFDVAVEVNAVIRPWQSSHDMDLTINVQPGMITAHADMLRFRQILRNLVSNAIRYGGPPVTIDATREPEQVVIEVTDHGDGVPSEAVDQMFEPYSHFASPKGQPSSVGLGLHVARRLAQLMGGDLTYRHEDGTTTFTLALPFINLK